MITQYVQGDVDLRTAQLKDVENYLRPRLRAFVEAGLALMAIRERRLYLNAGFDTFDAYVEKRWNLKRTYAYQLCDAAQVNQAIATSTETTTARNVENEAQARELAPLLGKPDELKAVWQEVVERTQGTVTAAAIRQVRREHEQRANPASPRPALAPRPEPAVPADAHGVFLLLTQVTEETRALGADVTIRGKGISPNILAIWARGFEDVESLCATLAEACRDQAG